MAGQAIVNIESREWLADLALAPWELAQGLGGIPGIPVGTGMLFDLGFEQVIEVTTEPMLFLLDIAFLSEDLVVTEVRHNVEPGLLLSSASPARYFLEVNGGELEGVEAGMAVAVTLLPLQEVPQVPSWTAVMYGFAGLLFAAVLLSTVVRGIAPADPAKAERPQLLAHTKPNRKPTRREVSVHSWEERDRLGIWITDSRTDKTLAEWWDDDARQMFEDGFFKPGTTRNQGITGKAFEDSVLDYAEHLGMLASTILPAVQPQLGGNRPIAALVEKWSAAKRNSALALKDLEAISHRYDIAECREALQEYRDLDRSDYGDAEEYQEARDEAWEAFIECLDSLSAEEEEEDPDQGKPRCAIKEQPLLPERHAAVQARSQKLVKNSADDGKKPRLEYLPDTPELLAWTIEDIGYRDRIDSAFTQAIARARGSR